MLCKKKRRCCEAPPVIENFREEEFSNRHLGGTTYNRELAQMLHCSKCKCCGAALCPLTQGKAAFNDLIFSPVAIKREKGLRIVARLVSVGGG
jgi:hypothetical protein